MFKGFRSNMMFDYSNVCSISTVIFKLFIHIKNLTISEIVLNAGRILNFTLSLQVGSYKLQVISGLNIFCSLTLSSVEMVSI